jgi:hypothetical protein
MAVEHIHGTLVFICDGCGAYMIFRGGPNPHSDLKMMPNVRFGARLDAAMEPLYSACWQDAQAEGWHAPDPILVSDHYCAKCKPVL